VQETEGFGYRLWQGPRLSVVLLTLIRDVSVRGSYIIWGLPASLIQLLALYVMVGPDCNLAERLQNAFKVHMAIWRATLASHLDKAPPFPEHGQLIRQLCPTAHS
jgi:hypothetical protein